MKKNVLIVGCAEHFYRQIDAVRVPVPNLTSRYFVSILLSRTELLGIKRFLFYYNWPI